MSYFVRKEVLLDGAVVRLGPFATDQEARLALANALEVLYDDNPALDFGDRPCEIEDAFLDGQKDLPDASGTILYSLSIVQE